MVDKVIDNTTNQTHSNTPANQSVRQTPLDPTDNAQELVNDTTGMTGISKNSNDPNTPAQASGSNTNVMSDFKSEISSDPLPEDNDTLPASVPDLTTVSPGSVPTGNETVSDVPHPHVAGEQGVNATNPDPASDDDTLANAQHVGLRLDEDEDHPKDMDSASDRDKAEEFHRSH